MDQLIENLKPIEINGENALILDLEKASPFEKNVYAAYLDGKLSSIEIFEPYHGFYQRNNKLGVGSRTSESFIVEDYANDIGECVQLCSLYDVVVLKKQGGGHVGKRLAAGKYNKVEELENSKKCSQSAHFYTHAGLHTVIKVMEMEYPDRLIGLAKSKQEIKEKVEI